MLMPKNFSSFFSFFPLFLPITAQEHADDSREYSKVETVGAEYPVLSCSVSPANGVSVAEVSESTDVAGAASADAAGGDAAGADAERGRQPQISKSPSELTACRYISRWERGACSRSVKCSCGRLLS